MSKDSPNRLYLPPMKCMPRLFISHPVSPSLHRLPGLYRYFPHPVSSRSTHLSSSIDVCAFVVYLLVFHDLLNHLQQKELSYLRIPLLKDILIYLHSLVFLTSINLVSLYSVTHTWLLLTWSSSEKYCYLQSFKKSIEDVVRTLMLVFDRPLEGPKTQKDFFLCRN